MMRNIVVLELTVILVFLSSATSLLFCQGKTFSEYKTRALQDTTLAAEYFAKGKALYEAAKEKCKSRKRHLRSPLFEIH